MHKNLDNIEDKANGLKRYVFFTFRHQRHCLKNIPFPLASRIHIIIEDEKSLKENTKVKKRLFTEPKKNINTRKLP